ncbi:hypothetical protein B0H15DRAFT_1019537 [Mycena belliarum]|uniref:Uncharacterized protein n=1 Tax=Mycena belliarum TaxID=1033014 RepID=A0AAD6XYK0_9AGAR|nr:hypothetical protein B0H15DRAFT_1019537 [Mycena belliae]
MRPTDGTILRSNPPAPGARCAAHPSHGTARRSAALACSTTSGTRSYRQLLAVPGSLLRSPYPLVRVGAPRPAPLRAHPAPSACLRQRPAPAPLPRLHCLSASSGGRVPSPSCRSRGAVPTASSLALPPLPALRHPPPPCVRPLPLPSARGSVPPASRLPRGPSHAPADAPAGAPAPARRPALPPLHAHAVHGSLAVVVLFSFGACAAIHALCPVSANTFFFSIFKAAATPA